MKNEFTDSGNFVLGSVIARRLEDIKLDKGFHGNGKKQLQDAWEIMQQRVEHALTHGTLSK